MARRMERGFTFILVLALFIQGGWSDDAAIISEAIEANITEVALDLAPAPPNITEMAIDYAPRLRFDSEAGKGRHCFPSSAEDYYNLRNHTKTSGRVCNLNYTTVDLGHVPTYWHAQACGAHLHIAYWNFFGYNEHCDIFGDGRRDAWFESLVVQIRNYKTHPQLHNVRFGQKKGWYTRVPSHYEVVDNTHPIAYVGKATHGFYHNPGGSGSCCYWEDFRNPWSNDQAQDTWLNLVEFDEKTPWMIDPTTAVWNELQVPRYRSDWNLCQLTGCTGAWLPLCTSSGCGRSDVNEDLF